MVTTCLFDFNRVVSSCPPRDNIHFETQTHVISSYHWSPGYGNLIQSQVKVGTNPVVDNFWCVFPRPVPTGTPPVSPACGNHGNKSHSFDRFDGMWFVNIDPPKPTYAHAQPLFVFFSTKIVLYRGLGSTKTITSMINDFCSMIFQWSSHQLISNWCSLTEKHQGLRFPEQVQSTVAGAFQGIGGKRKSGGFCREFYDQEWITPEKKKC